MRKISAEKDSYIEKELEELFSDILFKTNINGKEGYIYFLFEHKSYLSNKISLQLLKYMIKIWEQKINKGKASTLPMIIPLVVYHGETKWDVELSLGKLITGVDTLPNSIKKYIPDYQYILYDLSPYGDEEIKGRAKLRILLEILRAILKEELGEFIETLKKAVITFEELDQQEKGIDYFETFIRYIMNARKDITITDVYDVVKNISIERSETVMTIAEQLIKEGMEKGLEKGMEKGLEKGKIELAKEMLLDGEPLEKIKKYSKLTEEKIEEIRKELLN